MNQQGDAEKRRSFVPWVVAGAVVVLLLLATYLLYGKDLSLRLKAKPSPSAIPSALPTQHPAVTPEQPKTAATPAHPTGVITLTIWFPDTMFPGEETPAGKLLSQRLDEFHENHHGIFIHPVRKLAHGPGGMLDYLRTAHSVAPKILPDMAVLDAKEAYKGIQTGSLQPLDGLFPPSFVKDLYRFAQETGWEGEHWYTLFFQADMEHLATNPASCSLEASTWDELLSNKCVYLFPAAGEAGLPSDAELLHFFGSGGGWKKGEALQFDEESLHRLFGFYREGRDTGVIPKSVLKYATNGDCWTAFLAEKGTATQVDSSRYLTDRGLLREISFMPTPTSNGKTTAMADGWVVGMVTGDPKRQQAAVALLEWLMEPQWYGEWCDSARMLPTTKSGMKVWSEKQGADPYVDFLRSLLENAVPRPGGPEYEKSAAKLHKAIQTVLGDPNANADALIKSLVNPE